jgi:hypothetical protein
MKDLGIEAAVGPANCHSTLRPVVSLYMNTFSAMYNTVGEGKDRAGASLQLDRLLGLTK